MDTTAQKRSLEVLERCINLQADAEEDISRQQRLDDLIAFFVPIDGPLFEVTDGWCFCLPAAFRSALDIKLTPRMVDKKQAMRWTQGSWFHFEEGDVLYDCVGAYRPWSLSNFRVYLDIKKASPAQPGNRSQRRVPGSVIFDVRLTNAKQNQLASPKQIALSQDAFIRLLIDGTGLPEFG